MDIWNDVIGELWPEGDEDGGSGLSYLRGRLDRKLLAKATALRLATDLGSQSAASLQADWDWHYRFTYALLAPFLFYPEDPAQWFVDLGLNRYPQKARDVLNNIAIVERRQAAMASLLSNKPDPLPKISQAAYEWIAVQANPAWFLARWVMQIAVGLSEVKDIIKSNDLLRALPEEHLALLSRYTAALETVVAASKQAALEAIDRPAEA